MIKFRIFAAALGVALTVASAPALAKSRANQAGYAARAQAVESVVVDGNGISAERAQALRECNQLAEPIKGYTLITSQFAAYRVCMQQHGQPE